MEKSFVMFQECVMSCVNSLLLLIGSGSMLADAFGMHQTYIKETVLDMMGRGESIHWGIAEYKLFLDHMYRIVCINGGTRPLVLVVSIKS